MLTKKKIIIPNIGNNIQDIVIINWIKKEGDFIKKNEPIVEISTDKIDTEILSNYTGKVKKILWKKGEIVKIGKTIAIIEYKKEETKNKIKKVQNYKVIKINKIKKIISNKMINSKKISPHVTSFIESDVTNIVKWKKNKKNYIFKKEKINITYTPIFIDAIIKSIKKFPMINSSIKGNFIIKKKKINIGLAIALKNGNLIVPVIKNADKMNLIELSNNIKEMIKKSYYNKININDISDSTYTVSNIGIFKNIMGTPIIMQPQVSILALGVIVKKPSVIKTTKGEFIRIRSKMIISHSYDHRIINGEIGCNFIKSISNYLESFDINKKIY